MRMIGGIIKLIGIMTLLISFTLYAFSHGAENVSSEETESGSQKITVEDMTLEWMKDTNAQTITFTLTAPTTGWIAIGFEPNFIMKGADLKMCYVEDGTAYVEDHYANGWTSHQNDLDQEGTKDITNVSGSETEDSTTVTFTIPLNSEDDKDFDLTTEGEIEVILAYGKNDNIARKHQKHHEVNIEF